MRQKIPTTYAQIPSRVMVDGKRFEFDHFQIIPHDSKGLNWHVSDQLVYAAKHYPDYEIVYSPVSIDGQIVGVTYYRRWKK